ncbi:hypothetical protein L2E82_39653 [Cichorium intybus]|uniref:Uncharacterized protein n=1 Tax=Cichorium intybus TaxID=13427 RepID=A0ACB9AN69_CICIN|nr:hypothetical protein L2E82_39653 [Cichorium intybus]
MEKSLKCPGFRFKPTDVELVMYFLKKKLLGKKLAPEVIAEINIYDFSPWDLPAKSILSGDLEWYFFCPQSKKYSSGPRMNRATETGFWKSTGKDREVKYKGRKVAIKKTLVFHLGHPPKGTRTNWVIHEYKMDDDDLARQGVAQEAYVICNVYEKRGEGPQNGAQYGAPFKEEEWDDDDEETSTVTSSGVVNPNNASSSGVMDMTSPEPGPSTVTSSAVFGLCGATRNSVLDPNASSSGSSAITYWQNEKLTDVYRAPMLCNNNTQEVEDRKGKKVMTDDGIDLFKELEAMGNNDFGQDIFSMFSVDGFPDDDSLDGFLPDDLLDLD